MESRPLDGAAAARRRESMKLIVGLGNPGRKYEKTRHNVGWSVLARLSEKYGLGKPKAKFHGEVVEANLNGVRAVLLAPHTYMNRSGRSVVAARDFYKIDDQDILIVCDDFHLPLAKIRVRPGGSSGGQNGLDDILRSLGHQQVARLRLGVGQPPEDWDPADYVLSRFGKDEHETIAEGVLQATDAVAVWAADGVERCMNEFN